jgi:hypothetical protein
LAARSCCWRRPSPTRPSPSTSRCVRACVACVRALRACVVWPLHRPRRRVCRTCAPCLRNCPPPRLSHTPPHPRTHQPLEFVLAGTTGSCVVVALLCLRIALGWSYVDERLRSAAVPYEETGAPRGWPGGVAMLGCWAWQHVPRVLLCAARGLPPPGPASQHVPTNTRTQVGMTARCL